MTVAVGIGAVVLALVVVAVCGLFARRAEHSAQQAKAAARNAGNSATQAKGAAQQVQGAVVAFRDGRPSEVDNRPTCPYDGEPLAAYSRNPGEPSWFRHADGVEHDDFTAHRVVHNLPPQQHPSPFPPVQETVPATPPAQPSTVDTFFQRVSTAEVAGVVDVDRLRSGVGDITRNPEFAKAMEDIAERTRKAEAAQERPGNPRMPDPTRAARVSRARRTPPPAAPPSTNGDAT